MAPTGGGPAVPPPQPPPGGGRRRPGRPRLLPRLPAPLRLGGPRDLPRPVRAHDRVRRRRERLRLRGVRPLPALDALRDAARLPPDRRGGGRRDARAAGLRGRRPAAADLRRRPLRQRQHPVQRARPLRAADARLHRRRAVRRPRALRAPAARLPRPPRRPLGADRRRRRRRPPAAARDPPQPRARLPARRLHRRRPAQAGRADRPRALRARDDGAARPGARGRRARRGADRDPVRAGHGARARGHRLPRARRAGAHDADGVRAAADRRRRAAPGPPGRGRGHPRARAGADGPRPRRRLPDRPRRPGHGRGRLDRLRAVPPDRARGAEQARPARPRGGQPVRDPPRARRGPPRAQHGRGARRLQGGRADARGVQGAPARDRLPRRRLQARPPDGGEPGRGGAQQRAGHAGDVPGRGRVRRDRVRARLDRQGGLARHRDGRLEGARGVGRRVRRPALSRHGVLRGALRQRARLVGLGRPDLPAPDRRRRAA